MGNIKNDSIQTQYYEGEEYILNDNGICNEDSCKCKGFHHKLKIFYQSFEFESPTQTKNLANFFNDILKDNNICAFESFSFKSCTNGEENLDLNHHLKSKNYHINVKNLLSCYVSHLKEDCLPDIFALGEYTPAPSEQEINTDFLVLKNVIYKLGGFVNLNEAKDCSGRINGKRGMTILYRKDSKKWDRISIHHRETSKDVWRESTEDALIRNLAHIKCVDKNVAENEYKKAREIMKKRWQAIVSDDKSGLQPCAEIMFRNRYICIAHVPGCGAGARETAQQSMNQLQHFRLMGDCNFSIEFTNPQEHTHKKECEKKQGTFMEINTNCSDIIKCMSSPYPVLQGKLNLKASTVRNKKSNPMLSRAHDGIYNYISENAGVRILGSLWPLLQKKEKIELLSDHKGFLLELETNSSKDIDSISITSNESLRLNDRMQRKRERD